MKLLISRISLIFLMLPYGALWSQDGSLRFIGHHFFNEKPLAYTGVTVMSGNTVISRLETGESNGFTVSLPFGPVYDIYLKNAACQTVYLRVFTDIPANKRQLKTSYELDIPFFARDPVTFDTTQFRRPIHQIVFDGRSRFVDDSAYMNAFLKSVVRQQAGDEADQVIKPVHVKQYAQLVGMLCLDNDKQTPLKHKHVTLLNKNGGKIFSTVSSARGIFVFPGADLDIADGVQVELTAADNPNQVPVKLSASNTESIDLASPDASGLCRFRQTASNKLIARLTDKDYRYNIGGKLMVHTAGITAGAGKEVTLLNAGNVQLQKVKTDVFGNFLFTKIRPGETYSLAFDTAAYGMAPQLFTIKDKAVGTVDSLGNQHYLYRFRAESGTRFNDLLLDDSELKMNVSGRLYGENKNNPLSDFKVLLLGDSYRVIDSATTDKEGDFDFRYMPYNRQILFNDAQEKNILEAFNNIMVFDNEENLIKIVSTLKGRFKYKPLPIEQNRLTDVFVDDPWLRVVNPQKNKEDAVPLIVEDILFDFDKATLFPQSKQTLDKIILAMSLNPSFTVELGAHTDSKGSDAYNLKLSTQRAEAARSYMVAKGADPSRITARGYGESKLLNNCTDAVLCAEDEHAVNRRIEFKLIYTH